jgi:hypothetical protein
VLSAGKESKLLEAEVLSLETAGVEKTETGTEPALVLVCHL